jgi:hypothetical protein
MGGVVALVALGCALSLLVKLCASPVECKRDGVSARVGLGRGGSDADDWHAADDVNLLPRHMPRSEELEEELGVEKMMEQVGGACEEEREGGEDGEGEEAVAQPVGGGGGLAEDGIVGGTLQTARTVGEAAIDSTAPEAPLDHVLPRAPASLDEEEGSPAPTSLSPPHKRARLHGGGDVQSAWQAETPATRQEATRGQDPRQSLGSPPLFAPPMTALFLAPPSSAALLQDEGSVPAEPEPALFSLVAPAGGGAMCLDALDAHAGSAEAIALEVAPSMVSDDTKTSEEHRRALLRVEECREIRGHVAQLYGDVSLSGYMQLVSRFPDLFGPACLGITDEMVISEDWETEILEEVLRWEGTSGGTRERALALLADGVRMRSAEVREGGGGMDETRLHVLSTPD